MKNSLKLSVLALSLALGACSDDDDNSTMTETEVEVFGPYATGTSSESYKVYFDLDTGTTLELTDEQAETDTTWDIALERYKVYLNDNDADPVSIYNVDNNADFYDANGDAVAATFIAATPDDELQGFVDVTIADVPADSNEFVSDVSDKTIDSWYNYDYTTHVVSAAVDNYFVVKNADIYSKFSVTDLVLDGYDITDLTLGIAYDLPATDADTAATVTSLAINFATECANTDDTLYVDFSTASLVSADAAYDITITCDASISSLSIDMVDGATGMQDFTDLVNDDETAAIYEGYGYFNNNHSSTLGYSEVAKGSFGSTFVYGVNGGHILWSDYNVYIIKTADAYFKIQFTSYYDVDGISGSISFRSEELVAE